MNKKTQRKPHEMHEGEVAVRKQLEKRHGSTDRQEMLRSEK